MHTRFTIKFVAACALFIWLSGHFASHATSPPPAELQNVMNVQHMGTARLKMLGFQIYDINLWVAPDFSADNYVNSSFAIDITYLRNFANDAVAERSIKEMRGIDNMTNEQQEQWLAQMRKLFPNIKKGDRLFGIHKVGEGAVFKMNGKAIGEVRDSEFARIFFGIWLSPKTSQPQMRKELLGAAGTKRQ